MLVRLLASACAALALATAHPAAAQVITQPTPGVTAPAGPSTGPRDAQKPKETGTAVVRGRVIGGETGAPLRRAQVSLRSDAMPEGRSTVTDENGRYEFKDLPPGRVHVSASKGGYVHTAYGQRRPFQAGRPLELADGQVLGNVDFNLPRGGVITGRLTDEYGEPVAGMGIRVLRYQFVEGRRQLIPVPGGWASTDDLGRFRAFGLPAGDYYVSASPERYSTEQSDNRSGHSVTYYPGTVSVTDAQRLRVTPGTENTGANFALLAARTVRISGTALDSHGRPVANGYLMMQMGRPGAMSFTMGFGGQVKPDGSFSITDVSPGEYVLHLNTGMGGEDQESAVFPLTVGSEDITGLTLTATPPTLLTGQIVFETGEPPAQLRPSAFVLFAAALEPTSMMWGAGLTPRDDWTFEAKVREGPVVIRNGRLPDGWVIRSVLHGGVDVTDAGVPFRPGEQVDGLQIVMSTRVTRVTGTVSDGSGKPVRDYTVIIFSEDADRWGRMTRHVAAARPDQQGQFEITKLPAGHYLAVALQDVEDGQHSDPEFLQDMRAYATPLQLGDGDGKALTLTLTALR